MTLETAGQTRPVPKPWLDQFFMRNFTGFAAFNDTLVCGDGRLEAGSRVHSEEVRARLEEWLRGRKMIGPEDRLAVSLTPGPERSG